ncbi:dienelactone hydrolase family protein [Pseudonocardia phyllosphaerae]|uniref:dienelactone hydrolase family protein n=1 Tax=Pseudonocardia phyllosphaerae TaxID=3390502 RepID=UPI003979E9BC
MTEVLLFHHVLGRTPGVLALAERFRAAGHVVHVPDLYDGHVFATIDEGFAYAQSRPDLDERADAVAAELPENLVYAGISYGAMHAQRLAQTRPGAAGALLLEGCVPLTGPWAFGPWPDGVPVQIHGMADDPYFSGEGDLDAAREIVALVGDGAELVLHPGAEHLFADDSLPSYDAVAAGELVGRALGFLDRIGLRER